MGSWWLNLRAGRKAAKKDGKNLRKQVKKLEKQVKEHHQNGDSFKEGRVLEEIGFLYFDDGMFEVAVEYWTQALQVFQEINNRESMAETLSNLGTARRLQGDLRQAARLYNKALILDKKHDTSGGELTSLQNLGATWLDLGEYDNAFDAYNEALGIARKQRKPDWEALSLFRLGISALNLNHHRKAFDYFQEGLAIADALQNLELIIECTYGLGQCYESLGDYQQAILCYEDACTGARNLDDRNLECLIKIASANLHIHIGYFDQAREMATKIEGILPETPSRRLQIETALLRARIYTMYRMEEKANKQLEIAENTAKELPDGFQYARVLLLKSELKLQNKKHESAMGILFQINGKYQEGRSLLIDYQITLMRGLCYRGKSQESQALKARRSAVNKAQILGIPRYLWKAHHSLGRFYHHQHRFAQARDQYHIALKWIEQTAGNLDNHMRRVFLHNKERDEIYQDYVILLISSGHKEKAARILERHGSKSLIQKVEHFFKNGNEKS